MPSSSSTSLLPFVPRWLKGAALAVLLLNYRSLPTYWHWKVWYPALLVNLQARLFGVLPLLRALPTKGANPLVVVSRKRYFAGIDDIDYNLHLSNSAYAKNLDASRMLACVDLFVPFLTVGGWMALGGAHYTFIKEIPALASYEVEMKISGYGGKWLFLQGTFLTRPKNKDAHSSTKTSLPELSLSVPGASDASPSHSGSATPINTRSTTVRADGAVVHCISVSTYCFKLGRLTIPPAVILSFCGYGQPANWARTDALLSHPSSNPKKPAASFKAAREWLKEGWKAEEGPSVLEEFEERGREGGGERGETMREALAGFGLQREDGRKLEFGSVLC